MKKNTKTNEVSIVLPCLDEETTVGTCVSKALKQFDADGISGEVLVIDNGSTDGSAQVARAAGARVVTEKNRGYGNALRAGFRAAQGPFIIMADADDSYHFEDMVKFITKLRKGNDLVMGNRFLGGIEKNAMPFTHRIGTPVLSWIGRMLFGTSIRDINCGMRAMRKQSILSLDLESEGMEFAMEMIAKASLKGLKISEVATKLSRDGRHHGSHLRTFRDGTRILMYMCKERLKHAREHRRKIPRFAAAH